MDFIYDYEQFSELYKILDNAGKTISDNVEAIYNGIDAMNEGWSGAEYEEFRESAYNYKSYLDALEAVYGVYKTMLEYQVNIKIAGTILYNAVSEAIALLGDE